MGWAGMSSSPIPDNVPPPTVVAATMVVIVNTLALIAAAAIIVMSLVNLAFPAIEVDPLAKNLIYFFGHFINATITWRWSHELLPRFTQRPWKTSKPPCIMNRSR